MPTERVYPNRVMIVSAFLNKVTVSTTMELMHETGVSEQDLKRMVKDKTVTTSLNYNHNWVTLTSTIKKNKDHWGFFRQRIEKYSRTIPIFHIKRTTKNTLSYLASRRPWGLSEEEAFNLTGRDCKRPLKELEENNSIRSRIINGEKVYLNRSHEKAEFQIKERKINPKFKTEDEDDEEEIGFIRFEEFCKTFNEALNEMAEPCPISNDRITTLMMMFSTNRSLRTMETWVNFNQRIKDAIGLNWSIDHSTMCRDMGMIDELYLKKLFHTLVIKLHDKGIITGKFLVVDATHIYAFCNTRKDTNKHGVDGASWGNHHGSFYGYKVHILIDAESELPISMIMSTGKDYDSPHFIPLLDDCMEQYDFDDITAVLADAGYDVKSFRDSVLEKTGGIFLPACNPRKSRVLQRMKARVKKLFKTYGENIKTVEDGFRYLGQTFLTMFGIELGDKMDNKLTEMISERLNRHLRAGVERAFSRLKSLTSFEEPKARRLSTVKKTLWFCFIGQLVQALTAVKIGFKGSMRKRTALV